MAAGLSPPAHRQAQQAFTGIVFDGELAQGKSCDAPLLRTRYRLARMGDPTAGPEHIDLLYPVRWRYRGVYGTCRLATIERQVLHIVREDDLPGSEASPAWLSYLRGGSATNLRHVAAHNHQDVVSLARLMRHLADR